MMLYADENPFTKYSFQYNVFTLRTIKRKNRLKKPIRMGNSPNQRYKGEIIDVFYKKITFTYLFQVKIRKGRLKKSVLTKS